MRGLEKNNMKRGQIDWHCDSLNASAQRADGLKNTFKLPCKFTTIPKKIICFIHFLELLHNNFVKMQQKREFATKRCMFWAANLQKPINCMLMLFVMFVTFRRSVLMVSNLHQKLWLFPEHYYLEHNTLLYIFVLVQIITNSAVYYLVKLFFFKSPLLPWFHNDFIL